MAAVDARIRELSARHRALDSALQDEMRHPAVDSVRVRELKRRKLRLKEEIESLRTPIIA